MNIYKFGKVDITTNKAFITSIIPKREFYYYEDINSFTVDLINDYLVNKSIEITHALIQFYNENSPNNKTKELYWTNKKLGLHIRNIA